MRSLALGATVLSFAATVLAEANLTTSLTSSIILPSTFKPPQVFKNVNLVHVVGLEKSYPKESINVVIENIASTPEDEYYIPFTVAQMASIGMFEARDRKDPDAGTFDVAAVEFDPESDTQFYRIRLPSPLAPKAQLTIGITYNYLSAVHPLPQTVLQTENQYLVYDFSAYCASAYTTLKQKTEVKFSTSNIPEYTTIAGRAGEVESPQKQGTKLTYGPFGEVPAGAVEQVRVRYEFTKPVIVVSLLERDVEVSHWGGNVAFEERYTMHNRAANLSNQFSRVQWASSAYYNPPTTAIKELKFALSVGSLTPYFTDVIGNVSTSWWRSNKREASLELKPRYPIFGGWNYPFRVGWDADARKFLRSSGKSHVLKVPFIDGPRQPEGVSYEKIQVRVILPEGAENVKYHTPLALSKSSISLHRTFMDTVGRTALELTVNNVNDEVRDHTLYVTYDLSTMAILRKPLVIFSSFFSLYVVWWALGLVDISISGKK